MDDLPRIPLNPSRIAQRLTWLWTLVVIAGLCLSGLAWGFKVAGMLLWWALERRDQGGLNDPLPEALWCTQGQWFLQNAHGAFPVQLQGHQCCGVYLTGLVFLQASRNKTYHLALWYDGLADRDFRALRRFLQYGCERRANVS